jgi:hypothetical protein
MEKLEIKAGKLLASTTLIAGLGTTALALDAAHHAYEGYEAGQELKTLDNMHAYAAATDVITKKYDNYSISALEGILAVIPGAIAVGAGGEYRQRRTSALRTQRIATLHI